MVSGRLLMHCGTLRWLKIRRGSHARTVLPVNVIADVP